MVFESAIYQQLISACCFDAMLRTTAHNVLRQWMRYSDDGGATWSTERYKVPIRVTSIDKQNPWHGNTLQGWTVSKPIILPQSTPPPTPSYTIRSHCHPALTAPLSLTATRSAKVSSPILRSIIIIIAHYYASRCWILHSRTCGMRAREQRSAHVRATNLRRPF